ncbi:MAG: glycosyltransferase family 39 protein, partial [Anaerolineae bacterium]|nr:glycosyltransferase family 39 protein [Anaerolineae bacterium]
MRRASDRAALFVIIALFSTLGFAYSLAIPLFEAPDELWHFSFVRYLATHRQLPIQPREGKDMWLREAGQPPLYYILAAPVVALLNTQDFPDFVRFNVAHPAITPGSTSHFPNVFIHTHYEGFPYRGAVLAMHAVRLLTVLWGVGTLVGTYLLASQVLPQRPVLALIAVAVVAFNPHFIYISSVVNNDACAACLSTCSLWLAVRAAQEPRLSIKPLWLAGCVLGLTLLSKVSALVIVVAWGLALLLRWRRDRDSRALLTRGLVVFAPAAVVGGWWYGRNWLLYGDPLAWRVWLIDIGVHHIGLAELLTQFRDVATSFWSPYDGLFPWPIFWTLAALAWTAALGWVRLMPPLLRTQATMPAGEGLLVAGVTFLLLFASLLHYMMTTPSAEGRLLFPGIAAFASLLVLGWEVILPQGWRDRAFAGCAAGLLALSVATPLLIAARYAWPLTSSSEALSAQTTFDDAAFGPVRLLAAKVEPERARRGEEIAVTLYWQVAAPGVPPDLRAVVRLWTLGGRLAGQRDTTPAGEVYPPDLWRVGDIIRDTHYIKVRADGPAMCRVGVSIMAGQQPLGEVATGALLRLLPQQHSAEVTLLPQPYRLGEVVELAGYRLDGYPPSADQPLALTLYWHALADMEEDYTVFVHLLSAEGMLLGQGDGPPLNNDYPTSYWLPGERLLDTHPVSIAGEPPAGVYLRVGLYRLADGTRLPAYT